MELLNRLIGACSTVEKHAIEKDVSDMQLSAFEFRHYQTKLEASQQRLVERVVNQWVAMLVKGMILRVNGFEEKTYLDRDLLNLELNGELYPLEAVCRMEMYKESDDNILNVPWVVELTFDFEDGETMLGFGFERERHRLQFALTLRVLRTRNPRLNLGGTLEVVSRDEEDDEHGPSLRKIVTSNRYDVQGTGITVVISVGPLQILQHLQCNNRHVYLEFFSDYPRRDKFLYARSGYNNLPGSALLGDEKKKDEEKKEGKEGNVLCRIDFDLQNVKLKIPKAPFTAHGRLMAKDDFFPTVVASFELEIAKDDVFDRRGGLQVTKNPGFVDLPLRRAWHGEGPEEVAVLSVRFLGYVTDDVVRKKTGVQNQKASASSRSSSQDVSRESGGSSSSNGEEEEDEDEDEEESEDEEGNEASRGSSEFHRSGASSGS